jgi:nucleotide-binding universal stress UspA family protein
VRRQWYGHTEDVACLSDVETEIRSPAVSAEDDARSVVVGVDSTDSSAVAVEFAAREAASRHLPLTLVHPLELLSSHRSAARRHHFLRAGRSADLIGDITNRVRVDHPSLQVRPTVANGHAGAALVVAGYESGRGLAEALDTQCPVIIARRDDLAGLAAPVVVGVDWSTPSHRAVEFAFDEATMRGVPLLVIHAQPDVSEAEPRYAIMVDTLQGLTRRFPQVDLHHTTVQGATAVEVLLFASTAAGLVVVGSRGLGAFSGLLLGSVSQALVKNAHCPVAIVRSDDQLPSPHDWWRAQPLFACHVPPPIG